MPDTRDSGTTREDGSVMGNIERSIRPLDAGASRKEAQRAIATGIEDVVYHVRDDVNKAFVPLDAYLGAVEENRKLWARDHARGHKPTPDCPVCVKFGLRPNSPDGGQ